MRNPATKGKGLCIAIMGIAPLLLIGVGARAQSQPAQDNQTSVQDNNRTSVQNDDTARRAQFNQFLDSHQEIGEQVRRDPSKANDPQFQKNHPDLQAFLRDHPDIQDRLRANPTDFMRQDDPRDRGGDAQRAQLAEFDRFLDGHPEIAEQLRKNPSLADQPQFQKTHPALQTFLQDQPAIRQDLRQDPNAFMRQEDAYERTSRDNRQDNDDRVASFHKFLGDHRNISDDLSRDPSRVKDRDYMKDHPELEAYLNTRPDVRDQLMSDPKAFVNGSQQFNDKTGQGYENNGYGGNGTGKSPATTPSAGSGSTTPPAGSSSTPNPTNPAPTNKYGSK